MNPFEGREITKLAVITNAGVGITTVGENGAAKILDKSVEFPDSILPIYWVLDDNDKALEVIENCPVVVTYREADK